MELVVDLDKVTVALARPDMLDRLVVRVGAPLTASADTAPAVHRLGDVLVAAHAGRMVDASHAVVHADAVEFHAAGAVDDGWVDRFRRVFGGGELAAAVEWPSGPTASC